MPTKTTKTAAKSGAKKAAKKPRTVADKLHAITETLEMQAEFLIDWRKRSEDRIIAMETNAERWLKNYHEDIVAQIEVNRAKLIRLEQAAKPTDPPPAETELHELDA